MSLPEKDFAERSRSIFEQLRAQTEGANAEQDAQSPGPDADMHSADESDWPAAPEAAASPEKAEEDASAAASEPGNAPDQEPVGDEQSSPDADDAHHGEQQPTPPSHGNDEPEAAHARDIASDELTVAEAEPVRDPLDEPAPPEPVHSPPHTSDATDAAVDTEASYEQHAATPVDAAPRQPEVQARWEPPRETAAEAPSVPADAAAPPPREMDDIDVSAAPTVAPIEPSETPGAPREAPIDPTETSAAPPEAPIAPSQTPAAPSHTAIAPPEVDIDDLEPPEPQGLVLSPPADAPLPDPQRFVRPLPRVLAIANQKGGVGKTTTTVNLGASLAVLGYRVLVIDLDPQGNATTGLGINSRNLESSIYDVILHDTPLDDCVEPTSLRNLFVAPATIDLAGAEIELVPAFSREQRLKRALEEVKDDYEFVLIDCPPSLGLLTVNALSAASEVVVPIQCEYYALEGLGQLLRNINLVQSNLNPTLELSAIVLTMYDARTKLAEQVADEVRQHFGERVCRNVVPRTVRLSEAPSFGQPIIVFDPSSRGALAYRELAREVSGGPPQRTG